MAFFFTEEISGIFVKSISPSSAADINGTIKVNDRIVEVSLHYITTNWIVILWFSFKSKKISFFQIQFKY